MKRPYALLITGALCALALPPGGCNRNNPQPGKLYSRAASHLEA